VWKHMCVVLCGNIYINSVEIYVYCICVHTKYKSYVCCVETYVCCVEIYVNCVELWAYCICVHTRYKIWIFMWQYTIYVCCVCIHTWTNTHSHTSAASVTNTRTCVYNIQYVCIVYVCIQNTIYVYYVETHVYCVGWKHISIVWKYMYIVYVCIQNTNHMYVVWKHICIVWKYMSIVWKYEHIVYVCIHNTEYV